MYVATVSRLCRVQKSIAEQNGDKACLLVWISKSEVLWFLGLGRHEDEQWIGNCFY